MRVFPFVLAIWIFALDILSKYWTHLYLPVMNASLWEYPYGGIGIFRYVGGVEFSISHAINRGAAWGILADFQGYLLLARGAFVVGLIVALGFNRRPAWTAPLLLIITGATGNILDYFLYGHVVDMLHFVFWGYDFPVFNIADSAICLGIGWLTLLSWTEEEKKKPVSS